MCFKSSPNILFRDKCRSLHLIYEHKEWKDRKIGSPQGYFVQVIHSQIWLVVLHMMRFPLLWRSVMLEQSPAGMFCLFAGLQGGHRETQLPHAVNRRREIERWVLNSADFTSLHRAARRAGCSDVLSLSLCWQIRDRDKKAERWKPTRHYFWSQVSES